MPEIRPFRGICYTPGHLAPEVLAPPFDVIGEAQRAALAARSEHNVVLIDKGPQGHGKEWYSEAAVLRDRWLAEGVLARDRQPAFYGYRQTFSIDGRQHTRTGFVAAVRLAAWGDGIFPHERTRTGDRADRLMLTRAMQANMSPVFGLYRDPHGALSEALRVPTSPALESALVDDVEHTFWRIEAPAAVAALQTHLAAHAIVIADGHHRYETALAYQAEVRAHSTAVPGSLGADYVMMYLTDADSEDLVILPTHRIIGGTAIDQERLLNALGRTFDIYPIWGQEDAIAVLRAAGEDGMALTMCTQDMGTYLLKLRPDALDSSDKSPLAALDVALLQERILGPLLGISPAALAASATVTYTIDATEAQRAVASGAAQLAFLMNPTTIDQVWQTATAGMFMPQKSTYFYPKLLTGLVFNPLDQL